MICSRQFPSGEETSVNFVELLECEGEVMPEHRYSGYFGRRFVFIEIKKVCRSLVWLPGKI